MAAGVPHVSVYMLEVDEDSRLGRELIAGGTRYHAHHVPDEDLTADFYLLACEELAAAGIAQYEISNFARGPRADDGFPAHASRHNLKYWLRQPYMGFGVDAHSMLLARDAASRHSAVRFATSDELEALLSGSALEVTRIDERLGAGGDVVSWTAAESRGGVEAAWNANLAPQRCRIAEICSANLNRTD